MNNSISHVPETRPAGRLFTAKLNAGLLRFRGISPIKSLQIDLWHRLPSRLHRFPATAVKEGSGGRRGGGDGNKDNESQGGGEKVLAWWRSLADLFWWPCDWKEEDVGIRDEDIKAKSRTTHFTNSKTRKLWAEIGGGLLGYLWQQVRTTSLTWLTNEMIQTYSEPLSSQLCYNVFMVLNC